jgi:protein involved in polysaccharide export with SLBB domain
MPLLRSIRALRRWSHRLACAAAFGTFAALAVPASAQTSSASQAQEPTAAEGPVRLGRTPPRSAPAARTSPDQGLFNPDLQQPPPLPREPDEFERFVSELAGFDARGEPLKIRRFGSELQPTMPRQPRGLLAADALDPAASPLVPADYVIKPGDEVVVALWGSVDAELTLRVDRSGRITIPRVGTIAVAGVRFSDLQETVRRRVAQTFRNFEISVSMGALRAIRVFVTGFVERPGALTVPSLSTLSQVLLEAGGPSTAGSFRQIGLRRAGQPVVTLDLYDLLVKGERRNDLVVEADDVLHVGPVGLQVGMIGSVNRPAVFELLPGEGVRELLLMAGGLSAVADTRRLTLERLSERDRTRVVEWPLPESAGRSLQQGDVVRAISTVATSGSQLLQNKRVRIEGEVNRPGTFVMLPGTTLRDAIETAGGLTSAAYLFGTELQRESVRRGQQDNYDRALRDVETEFARANTLQRGTTPEDTAAQTARAASTSRLIERLRALRPNGRVVLELRPDSRELPPLVLEDGDRLVIPARSTTVGVFGSVFSTGNYLFGDQRTLGDYLRLAGGPTRAADSGSVFVIRANGTVFSERQSSNWFGIGSGNLLGSAALPGDTIFVPEDLNRTTFIQGVKDWTQILFQLGLGVAAFKSLGN